MLRFEVGQQRSDLGSGPKLSLIHDRDGFSDACCDRLTEVFGLLLVVSGRKSAVGTAKTRCNGAPVVIFKVRQRCRLILEQPLSLYVLSLLYFSLVRRPS